MWIEREISEHVRSLARQRPVIVLTGARQTGKTSLLEQLFPEHDYVSLDLPSEAASAELDPAAFFARVTDLRDFERFVRACALRSGQLLNKSDLARDIGISVPTVGAWLAALQASGLVALLEPWFSNQNKRLSKTPKLYFCDTGLLAYLINLRSVADLHASPLRGALFETAIYCELRRALGLRQELSSLFFWRDRTTEVDFVLDRGGRLHLFEVKWSELPRSEDTSQLHKVAAALAPEQLARMAIVARAPHRHPVSRDVEALTPADLVAEVAKR